MKILMSALACEPGKGSELEVGFRALMAAASRHEVWLLTNSATVSAVRCAIAEQAWADRVHLEGIYFEVDDELYPRLTTPRFHWYYDRWQRRAAVRAAELARQIDFDVVHHVTLAANWTRAGVTAVDKPLVWGPVGGGVEMPLSLAGELGWRGLVEEVARTVARPVLAQIGPARLARQRAVVIFAQNRDTARMMASTERVRVLSNATSVDIQPVTAGQPRGHDIILAARLLPWKGGRLAVRALRYVRHPNAVLRIFGDGPERRAIARAAQQWAIADRVQLEGRIARDELLSLVATAGVFLHPAFHDEAGLAVAEALSLGTPVVCLDCGGPPELLAQWPGAAAQAVRPESPEKTAQALASAIDRYLFDPPAVAQAPRHPITSFDRELLAAYEAAANVGRSEVPYRSKVWAFPSGKPQLFADTPDALLEGVMVYGFGRRFPRWKQQGLAIQLRIPVLRLMLAERTRQPTPVCGWAVWHKIQVELERRNARGPLQWIHFQSQWGKDRSNVLGVTRDGVRLFVVVQPVDKTNVHDRLRPPGSFRVPKCTDAFSHDEWAVRQYEPLPRLHQPATWNAHRIRKVAADASLALEGLLPRSDDIPAHWRTMHGDFVPWNLREDAGGRLWLLDWEDAGWGPPLADFVRYAVAYHALGWLPPDRIAAIVTRTVAGDSLDLIEVATFWLAHPNLRPVDNPGVAAPTKDSKRAMREVAVFRRLASISDETASVR